MELQNANKTHQHSHERKVQPSAKPEVTTEVATHPLLALHRAVGNRALARLIQTKLTISHPGDKYEQEADRTAEAVMRMPEAWVHRQEVRNPDRRSGNNSKTSSVQMQVEEEEEPIQRQPVNEEKPLSISRQSDEEQEEPLQAKLILPSRALQRQQMDEEEKLQTKELGDPLPQVTPALENRIYALRAGGQPLPASLQTFYESRFGYDFGGVRVHTDAQAADLARQVHAQAFTVGSDVVFGAGHYDPDSSRGKTLLAHELTHVVQQGAAVQRKPRPVSTAQRQIQREGDDESWFSKAKKAVSGAVSTVKSAVGGVVSGGLEWVLNKVKEFAAKIPGYKLLAVILGKDPVTNERVDRSAENLVGGFLSLLPGGNTIFENLKKSGALAEALGWLNDQITKLELTWDKIKGLFSQAVKALSPTDILDISGAAQKVVSVFNPPLTRIKNFAVAAGQKLLEFIFKGALNLAGALGAKVLEVLKKAGAVFSTIIKDPVGFLGNLLKALKKGFEQFSANILEHLKAGLIGWLLGALQGAGLQLPEKFDLKGILSIVLQVLGLTYNFLRAKLVKLIGEERVAFIEKAFDFVKTLATEGLAAAWEKIVEFFGSLKDIVIGAIREWVVTQIVKSAITKLVTMFNPAGAVIQAIITIYNTVMFFIERIQQIAALAEAVFDSIANIAAGNISAAANYVEKTMARTIPVIISFLARLLGLGGISEKIKNIIKGIQERVDKAIDKLVNFIVEKVKGLLGKKEEGKPGPEAKPKEGEIGKSKTFAVDGETHQLIVDVRNQTATVLLASEPTPLERFLKRTEVQDLKKNDSQKHVAQAEALLAETNVDATSLLNAVSSNKETEAKTKDKKTDKDLQDLIVHLRWILEALGEYKPDHPKVDTYGALVGKVKEYTPHHVPPKALANWIFQQVMTIPDEIRDYKEVAPVIIAATNARKEYQAGGPNLSCILIHQNTHIRKTDNEDLDAYRAHHGKKTSELVAEKMKKRGLKPITKGGDLLVDSEDIAQQQEEEREGGKDITKEGMPSTQFYLKELNAAREEVKVEQIEDVEDFLSSIRDVFGRAHYQSRAAVEIALENSVGKDGPPEKQKSAMDKLKDLAKEKWLRVHSMMEKLTHF